MKERIRQREIREKRMREIISTIDIQVVSIVDGRVDKLVCTVPLNPGKWIGCTLPLKAKDRQKVKDEAEKLVREFYK